MTRQNPAPARGDEPGDHKRLRDELGRLRRKIARLEKAEEERRRAEAARRASEEKYRNLVESTEDLVFIVDEKGIYTYVNPRFERVTGYSAVDLVGRPFTFLVAREYVDGTVSRFRKGIRGEETPPYEADLLHRTGKRIPVEFLVTTQYDPAGRPVGRFGIGRDITERRRAEERLKEQSRQLRILSARLSEAEEAERKRIARELHDQVGQNLTVVGINLSILKAKLPVEGAEALHARIEDSLVLVEEITEFTRGLMSDLRPPDMDILGLVAAIGWYGERFSLRTGVGVRVEGGEIQPRPAPDVENNLFRIVQEVLNNVAKHARASRVKVRIEVREGTLRLEITDDGVGFDPSRARRMEERGGWGLMTMAERAEAINGRFRIESAPGKGTRVTVEVPP